LYGYRFHGTQMSGLAGHRRQMTETLSIIEAACRRSGRPDAPRLRRQASEAYLFGAAVDEAFRGERTTALKRSAVALRLRPGLCFRSRYLWIVLHRIALGERGYAVAHSVMGRGAAAARDAAVDRRAVSGR
jgi:hypothetical protein